MLQAPYPLRRASIVPGDFAGLGRLDFLAITYSPMLTTVPANAFSEVSTILTVLVLNWASITSVHEDAFGGLISLTALDLGDNRISSLHEDTQDGFRLLWQDAVDEASPRFAQESMACTKGKAIRGIQRVPTINGRFLSCGSERNPKFSFVDPAYCETSVKKSDFGITQRYGMPGREGYPCVGGSANRDLTVEVSKLWENRSVPEASENAGPVVIQGSAPTAQTQP